MNRSLLKRIKIRLLDAPEASELTVKQVKVITDARIRRCRQIDIEVKGRNTPDKRRYYAHAGHTPGYICVAGDFSDLPLKHRTGILLHEIGHLLTGCGSEPDADLIILKVFGIEIKYDNDRELQYVDKFRI